jgi:hypothetical protein
MRKIFFSFLPLGDYSLPWPLLEEGEADDCKLMGSKTIQDLRISGTGGVNLVYVRASSYKYKFNPYLCRNLIIRLRCRSWTTSSGRSTSAVTTAVTAAAAAASPAAAARRRPQAVPSCELVPYKSSVHDRVSCLCQTK